MAVPADFTIKAHDRLPAIQATLATGGGPVDLTGAQGVKFIMAPTAGGTPKVAAAGVIVDATNGVVRYDWLAVDTATPGSFLAEWQVTWADGRPQTFPTLTYHTVNVVADLDAA
jgi:hypothetical protein